MTRDPYRPETLYVLVNLSRGDAREMAIRGLQRRAGVYMKRRTKVPMRVTAREAAGYVFMAVAALVWSALLLALAVAVLIK